MKKVCAYCGSEGPLTREHIMPKSILDKANESSKEVFNELTNRYVEKMGKIILAELTIGDVCGTCNNGSLSVLDRYGSSLYDKSFSAPIKKGQSTTFQYDYHLLLRWLLKLSYNSARVSNEGNADVLSQFKQYILGLEDAPRDMYLYVLPVTSYKFSAAESEKMHKHMQELGEIPPVFLRISEWVLKNFPFAIKPIRMVALNSYYFFIFCPQVDIPGHSAASLQRGLRKKMTDTYQGIVKLKPKEKITWLPPPRYNVVDMYSDTINWDKISQAITAMPTQKTRI